MKSPAIDPTKPASPRGVIRGNESQADIFQRFLIAFVSKETGKSVTELGDQHKNYADTLISKLSSRANDPYLRAQLGKLAEQADISNVGLSKLSGDLIASSTLGRSLKEAVFREKKPTSLSYRPTTSTPSHTNHAERMRLQVQRGNRSGEFDL